MYVVIVETQIDVEERSGEPAYLARLQLDDGGAIEEEFGLEVVNHENRRALAMVAMPGEVFSACRWWNTEGEDEGGRVWFTVNELGDVRPISEDEAKARLKSNGHAPSLSNQSPEAPANIFCRPTTLSGKPILRGNL